MDNHSLRQLLFLCDSFPGQVNLIPEEKLSAKPDAMAWSKKEIIGHLCDSAFVNLTRLIRGQAEDAPQIFYDQDEWVRLQRYNSYNTEALLRLWYSLNTHFCHVCEGLDKEAMNRVCLDKEGNPWTLKALIDDYLIHLQHHLNQILDSTV